MVSQLRLRLTIVLFVFMFWFWTNPLIAATPRYSPPLQGDDLELTQPIQRGGLDLILIIDNSASMFLDVQPVNGQCEIVSDIGNDETEVRFDVANDMIDILIQNAIGAREQGNPVDHRIGIITFGSTAAIDVPLTSLSVVEGLDTSTFLREEIMQRVRRTPLDSTDPQEAFALAAEMFRTASPTTEPRAKGVLLVTDGVPGFGCTTNRESVERYMGPFQEDIRRNFPAASADQATDGFHVWVLATNEDWPIVLPSWQAVIGDNWKQIVGVDTLYITLNDIVQAMYPLCENPAGCFIDENFVMPPYVQRATFRVFGTTPTVRESFQLNDQTGAPVDYTNTSIVVKDEEIGGSIRRIDILNPQAGNWSYTADQRVGVEVQVRQDLSFFNLTNSNEVLNQLSAETLVFQLQNDEEQAVSEIPEFTLQVTAQVLDPTGQYITSLEGNQTLAFNSIGNGLFESRDRIPFETAGTYTVLIRATRTDGSGNEVDVVKTKSISLTVSPVDGQIRPPTANLTPLSTVNIEVEALDRERNPIQVGVEGNLQVTGILYPQSGTLEDGRRLNFVLNDQGLFIPDSNSSIGQLTAGDYKIDVKAELIRPTENLLLFEDTEFIIIDRVQAQIVPPVNLPLPFQSTLLVYQISDSQSNIVEANPQSGANVVLQIITPTGFVAEYPMQVVDGRFTLPYTLPEAGPGDYRLKATGSININGLESTLFETGEFLLEVDPVEFVMVEPATDQPPLERATNRFRFELRTNGNPLILSEAPDFSGSYLIYPSGVTETLTLTLQGDGSLGTTFIPYEPGEWMVQTQATFGVDQREIPAIEQKFSFSVLDAVPIGIYLTEPTNSQNIALRAIPRACWLPCQAPESIQFVIELRNEENSQPIRYAEATTRAPTEQIIVEVTDGNNQSYSEVSLIIDERNPHRLIGTIHNLNNPTDYTLVARLDESKPPTTENYSWDTESVRSQIDFSRALQGNTLIAGYIIDLSAIVLMLALLIFIIFLIYFSLQPLQGHLEFVVPNSPVPVHVPIRTNLRFTPTNTFNIRDTSLQRFGIKSVKVAPDGLGKIRYILNPGFKYVKNPPASNVGQSKVNYNATHFSGSVSMADRFGSRVGAGGAVTMRYIVEDSKSTNSSHGRGTPPRR